MREIKFRAWDKLNKKWFDTGLVYPAICLGGGIIAYKNDERVYNTEHIELMQYTGLKDKNGKEIYEGDVVKFMYLNVAVPEERIMPVELVGLGDDMKVRVITAYSPFCYTTGGGYRDKGRETVDCYLTPPSDCEIIGNIYENKELCK